MNESEVTIAKRLIGDRKIRVDDCGILLWAAINGHLLVIKYLKSIGFDIINNSDIIIGNAILYEHLDIVKYLVEIGVDPFSNGGLAMKFATQYDRLEIIKYLISIGVDPTANNHYVLMTSSKYGYTSIIRYIASIGVDITVNDNCALVYAILFKRTDAIKCLITLGAYHHTIDPWKYVSILNCQHLKYRIDRRLCDIIINREKEKITIMNCKKYSDVSIITHQN